MLFTEEQTQAHLRGIAKVFLTSLYIDSHGGITIDTKRPFGSIYIGDDLIAILGIVPESMIDRDGMDTYEFNAALHWKYRECYIYVLKLYEEKLIPFLNELGNAL